MSLHNILNTVYPYRQFLVAFSGGLDSTVLLHILMLWRKSEPDIKLRAIHVHHGLDNQADDWALHCQSICSGWKIPLVIERVIVSNKGLGVEGQARKVRYAVFKKSLLLNEILVTAHHLDDQSETFLLALKRGSGPSGLSGMSIRTIFGNTHIMRPLLNETRKTLLHWAHKHNLSWIEDKSNFSDIYDRNFLRLRVLPLLIQRWPYFAKTVARSAALCAEQENLLDELLSEELTKIIGNNGMLNIAPLISISMSHRAALLRRWLALHRIIMPSKAMINRIWNEVAQAREDASPYLCLHDCVISRFHGQLWWFTKRSSLREIIVKWPNINNELILPKSAGRVALNNYGNVRLPLTKEKVTIRFQATGVFRVVGRTGSRKLKKIWQEYSVPPWQRSVTPLLFYGETLIAAAGVFITKEGWAERGVQFTWKI